MSMKHLSGSLWLAAFLAAGVCWDAHAESVYENYTFTNLAGMGPGSIDGSNSVARFSSPSGVTVDGAGNVYVADTGNHTLRKILPVGRVATVAGLAGSSGSADGTGGGAQFNLRKKRRPIALAIFTWWTRVTRSSARSPRRGGHYPGWRSGCDRHQ